MAKPGEETEAVPEPVRKQSPLVEETEANGVDATNSAETAN